MLLEKYGKIYFTILYNSHYQGVYNNTNNNNNNNILLLLLLMREKSIRTLVRGTSELLCHRKSMEIRKTFID